MMEDIRDAIEKKRDLEIKNKEGATAVSLDYSCSKGTYHFFFVSLRWPAGSDNKQIQGISST